MPVQTFRDLRVWQVGMELAVGVHDLTKGMPTDHKDDLANQLRRAVFTVPAKIAHGHGRQDLRAYIHNLAIARSALAEVATGLNLLERLSYGPAERLQALQEHASSLDRQLLSLSNSLLIRLREVSISFDPYDDPDEL